MQDTINAISPDGQWLWDGTQWVPNNSNSMTGASGPLPFVAQKPKTKHLGIKITGGILGGLLVLGIATAGLVQSIKAGGAALTSPVGTASPTPIVEKATVEADGNPLNNEVIPGSPANGVIYLEEEMPELAQDGETDEYLTLKDVKVVATSRTKPDGTGKYLASFTEPGSDKPRTFAVEWFEDGAWSTTENSFEGSVDQIPDNLRKRLLDEPIPHEVSPEA